MGAEAGGKVQIGKKNRTMRDRDYACAAYCLVVMTTIDVLILS